MGNKNQYFERRACKTFVLIVLSIILIIIPFVSSGGEESEFDSSMYFEIYSFNTNNNEIIKEFHFPETFSHKENIIDIFPSKNAFLYSIEENDSDQLLIYSFSSNESEQIISQSHNRRFEPKIYGNKIVFVSKIFSGEQYMYHDNLNDLYYYNIELYNIDTQKTTSITSDNSFKMYPLIYKNIITWTQVNAPYPAGGNQFLYYYNLNTEESKKLTMVDDVAELFSKYPIIDDEGIFWIETRSIGHPYVVNQTILNYDFDDENPQYIESQIGAPISNQIYDQLYKDNEYLIWINYNQTKRKLYAYNLEDEKGVLVSDLSDTLSYFGNIEIGNKKVIWIQNNWIERSVIEKFSEDKYILNNVQVWLYDLVTNKKEIILSSDAIELKISEDFIFWIQKDEFRQYKLFSLNLLNNDLKQIYSSQKELKELKIIDPNSISWKESEFMEICPKEQCEFDGNCYHPYNRANGKYCLANGTWTEQKLNNQECELDTECQSFACENNICLKKENTWDKFLYWFKNLFGWFSHSVKECEDIKNKEYRDLCNACENKEIIDEKDICFMTLVFVTEEKVFCDKISNQKSKDSCYGFVSRKGQNECPKIKDEWKQSECYRTLAKDNQNKEICKLVTTEIIQNWCYEDLANIMDDITICNEIGNGDTKNKCIATISKNEIFCKEIKEEEIQALCYLDLSQIKKDKTICDNIKSNIMSEKGITYKELCYAQARNFEEGYAADAA